MKHSPAPRRAFTLIEILVVIAIIGILSAILFPVFSRARENGRKTVCLSNMRQLGLAFQQYAQDSRGKYPLSGNFQAWAPGYAHWVTGTAGTEPANYSLADIASPFDYYPDRSSQVEKGALFPYVKNTSVYVCPSNKDGLKKHLSYSMNCAVSGLNTSKITSPGDIVLLIDEQFTTDGFFWAANDIGSTDKLTTVHNGGGNLLFADGHVKFFTFDSLILDKSTEGLANKSRLTGSPRFHDRAFGSPTGSSTVAFQTAPGVAGKGDSCGINPPVVTTPTTPP